MLDNMHNVCDSSGTVVIKTINIALSHVAPPIGHRQRDLSAAAPHR
ncbi:MAG: hypothetical protein JWP89_2682 [Schlesneria sp.]|nr:hypothetical protein [Schlesneria sp.]